MRKFIARFEGRNADLRIVADNAISYASGKNIVGNFMSIIFICENEAEVAEDQLDLIDIEKVEEAGVEFLGIEDAGICK